MFCDDPLEKFFDGVNHDRLMAKMAGRVSDKRLLKLIRTFLQAGVMEGGLVRVMESLTRFLMSKLKLQVNPQKSAVARPWARKFLGFSFTSAGIPKRRIAPKAVDRFQERVRELTGRNRGVSNERMAEELSRYLRGWIGYFGKCEMPSVLAGLEQWLRRRLRSAILKQWKRGTVRFAELRRRDVRAELAAQTAGSPRVCRR